MMYIRGQGVVKNEGAGLEWLKKAAQQGSESAQYELGLMFEVGAGTARDLDAAEKWYGLAAEQGSEPARGRLAQLRTRATSRAAPDGASVGK
jgi:TPR repeat protein